MITEYAVPSLALNYHCKKYQIIYESVYSYLCTCMRNKYSCKSEFVWNVHIQVMLKVISISILNMHELVETWLPEAYFFKLLEWQSIVHFIRPNKLTICQNINGFQIPVKSSCSGHRWCRTKDFFAFCSGKICLVCFHAFLFFCFMSSVSGTQNKCPNSHHSHPVHLFNTWIYRECKVQNGWIS